VLGRRAAGAERLGSRRDPMRSGTGAPAEAAPLPAVAEASSLGPARRRASVPRW
jgi:hypothetical protein